MGLPKNQIHLHCMHHLLALKVLRGVEGTIPKGVLTKKRRKVGSRVIENGEEDGHPVESRVVIS